MTTEPKLWRFEDFLSNSLVVPCSLGSPPLNLQNARRASFSQTKCYKNFPVKAIQQWKTEKINYMYLIRPKSHLWTSLVTLVYFFNLSVNYSKDECDLCFQDEQLVQKYKITKEPYSYDCPASHVWHILKLVWDNNRKTSATYLLRVGQILPKRSKLQRLRSPALELDKPLSHAPGDSR